MLEIDPRVQLGISKSVCLRELPESDQYYAFNIESGDHFALNRTAHWVLQRISLNVDFASLLSDFGKEFDLDREEALGDLSELVEFALENKIIIRRHYHEER